MVRTKAAVATKPNNWALTLIMMEALVFDPDGALEVELLEEV